MAELSTYADVTSFVREIIQDGDSNYRVVSDDDLDIWANEVMRELGEYAEYIDGEDVAPAATVAGGGNISIEGDPYGVWRVEIEDEAIPPTTSRELYGMSRTYQQQTGRPRYYYRDGVSNYLSDELELKLWPIPNATYTLRVFTTVPAEDLDSASGTNLVQLPLWAVPVLAWGMLSKFYSAETRMSNRGASAVFGLMYNDGMVRLRVRSYSRLQRKAAWGGGRKSRVGGDLSQLMPADGFPTS